MMSAVSSRNEMRKASGSCGYDRLHLKSRLFRWFTWATTRSCGRSMTTPHFTPSKRGVINVVKPLEIDQRRFRAGQRLDLRISAPRHVGQVLRFNLERGKQPKALRRCMPIGSTSIRQSC